MEYLGSYLPQAGPPPRAGTPPPPQAGLPWEGTPLGRYPLEQCMLGVTSSKRMVCILLECILVTTCKRSLGQGNMFTGICLSTGGSTWPGAPPIQTGPPPCRYPPTPPGWSPLGRYTPRQVPPGAVHAGSYEQQTDGMYSTGMHSCYHPANEVWGKVICLQASVYPQGGVPDQVHPPSRPGTPPQDQVPSPWADTPPGPGTPPGADIPPGGGWGSICHQPKCSSTGHIINLLIKDHCFVMQNTTVSTQSILQNQFVAIKWSQLP